MYSLISLVQQKAENNITYMKDVLDQIIHLSLLFFSCMSLPVRSSGTPLTLRAEWKARSVPRQHPEGYVVAVPVQIGVGRHALDLQHTPRHHAGAQLEVQTLVACLKT